MAELLLTSEQVKELREILKFAKLETKFVFCFISSKTMEENFEEIKTLLKSNDCRVLYKKFGSAASEEKSKVAVYLCANNNIDYNKLFSDCPYIMGYLNGVYFKDFVEEVYKSFSYEGFKSLVSDGKIRILDLISSIIPQDKYVDFLSQKKKGWYHWHGDYLISHISIGEWFEKTLPLDRQDFIRLCLKYNSEKFIEYSIGWCNRRDKSVNEHRLKSIFRLVPDDMKIEFFIKLYKLNYKGNLNIFSNSISYSKLNSSEELQFLSTLDFIKNIRKESWYDLLNQKVPSFFGVEQELFTCLRENDIIFLLTEIPLEDLKKLASNSIFEFEMRSNDKIAKLVNDRIQGKEEYSLSSLLEN